MKHLKLITTIGLLALSAIGAGAQTLSIRQENLRHLKEFNDRIVHDTFRVGKTGNQKRYSREQLIRLFDLWRRQYGKDGISPTFQIPEHSVKLLKKSVFQVIDQDTYLIGSADNLSAFEAKSGRTWTDDSFLVAYAIPNGTFAYTNVLGAQKTVKKWSELALELPEDNELSTDDFIQLLQNGKEYVVWEVVNRQCYLCNGRTYLHGQAQNNENPNTKYPCPHCFTGEETIFKKWLVKW